MIPPGADAPIDPVAASLWQQRRVMLSGALDAAAVMELTSTLMALDGQSSDDIDLVINSRGGPMAEVAAVLDVFDLMRAKVNTTCLGGADGTAAVVLACGTGTRRAAPHARVNLRTAADQKQSMRSSATDIQREADAHAAVRTRLADTLSSATGQPADEIASALEHGHPMSASEAVEYGLVDLAAIR